MLAALAVASIVAYRNAISSARLVALPAVRRHCLRASMVPPNCPH